MRPHPQGLRLAASGGGLSIVTNNLDATLKTSIAAEAEGEMAVPLGLLVNLVKTFPAGSDIVLTCDDGNATIACGGSRITLPAFPLADLPEPLTLGEETGTSSLMPRPHVTCSSGRRLRPRTRRPATISTASSCTASARILLRLPPTGTGSAASRRRQRPRSRPIAP